MPEFARLMEGYERFRQERYSRDSATYADLGMHGQHPELMVISCSDSRVDPALIFDIDPGDIFVVRNVAALIPPFHEGDDLDGAAAAVEFAVGVLEVRQIVVMGHSSCGGCNAALTGAMAGKPRGQGGYVARWVDLLADTREEVLASAAADDPRAQTAMEQAAVRTCIANLHSYPQIAEREAEGSLILRGTYFSIPDGVLHVLDLENGSFSPV